MHTRIREVRKARGLTLHDVANRCVPPTTAQTIGRLETGTRTVSVGWLNRIAAALGVETSELVTLPLRADVPVAALVGAGGVDAPRKPLTILPPLPGSGVVAVLFETGQGDYRAGDELWAERLGPERFGLCVNRDVLAPRAVGRFAFGRLVATEGGSIHLLPLTPGARQVVLRDVPWVAVARRLVRNL